MQTTMDMGPAERLGVLADWLSKADAERRNTTAEFQAKADEFLNLTARANATPKSVKTLQIATATRAAVMAYEGVTAMATTTPAPPTPAADPWLERAKAMHQQMRDNRLTPTSTVEGLAAVLKAEALANISEAIASGDPAGHAAKLEAGYRPAISLGWPRERKG